MKKLLAMVSLLLAMLCIFGCNDENIGETDKTSDHIETEEPENTGIEELCEEIMLTDEFVFKATSDNTKLSSLDYVKVSQVDEKYSSTEGEITYIDYTAPIFELGGIAHPDNNGGILNRLDGTRLEEFKSALISDDIAPKFSYHTAGATLRFCTNAKSITIKATQMMQYNSNTTEKRGTMGFDLYIGTGTSRTYGLAVAQSLISVSNGEKVTLPGGYCEVLIHLPQMAALKSFQIGFDNANVLIAPPTDRAMDPIVFYGSGITQGMSSSRAGTTYANTVCRMLNADCINLGFYEGAHGEQIMADYIAGLEKMSAFVMEYDSDSTVDELRANHYNFYKTVRDAHPDVPMVIMSDPILPMTAPEEAAERAAIIKATCERARAEGDENIYFLDGAKVFPMTGGLIELYTGDAETLSDTGAQYLAAAVYDVINSAFVPDSEKSGTDRLPGLFDPIDFVPESNDLSIDESSAVAISDVDEKYVDLIKDGVTYLSVETPQFSLGGIEKPSENGGMYLRVDIERKEEFISNLHSAGYTYLFERTPGVTLRFITNAEEIYLNAELSTDTLNSIDFSPRGVGGFDVYVGSGSNRVYCGEAGQDMTGKRFYEKIKLPGGFVEVMIDFPTYSGVSKVSIGFSDSNAKICAPTERETGQIVFYGSSITQGCSAARPGLIYTNIVSRFLDADSKNLGFASSARGEQIMAEYIATLDMAAFVLDYDYNSAVEELAENHYNFYKTVRDAHPDIPIVMMSRPIFRSSPSAAELQRIRIVEDTYNKAVAAGDKNVYIIRGDQIFPFKEMADLYTIDNCHPNDAGFYYMAKACYEVLDEALQK